MAGTHDLETGMTNSPHKMNSPANTYDAKAELLLANIKNQGTSWPKRVTVIIPNWNGAKWLPHCLQGLFSQTFQDFHVIFVDNGSTDASIETVKRIRPQTQIMAFDSNRGFAAGINAGIGASQSAYIATLNTDTCPRPTWLASLVKVMDASAPEVGCLASKMLDFEDPDLMENGGDVLSWQGMTAKRGHGQPASDFTDQCEVLSPCAGAALYRSTFLEKIGGFDERFFAYLEDVDLGLRGRLQGYRCLYVPGAEVLHQGHGSELAHGSYVRLITRNRLMLLLKNIPSRLLCKHAGSLLYGQWYYFICHRSPLQTLAGYFSFLPLMGHTFRQHNALARKRTVETEGLLVANTGVPSLRSLFKQWMG